METSDHFAVVEGMIRKGEVAILDLAHLLHSLEEQGHITAEEHRCLLELAEGLNAPPL